MRLRLARSAPLTRRNLMVGAGAALTIALAPRFAVAETVFAPPASRSVVEVLPILPIVRPQHVPVDEGMLFFAQNSINDNVLVYAARTTPDGALDPAEPMTVYWRRYAEEGQKRELNFFERNFALGLATTAIAPERWSVEMIGWRRREITVDLGPDRRPRATIDVDHRPVRPIYIYVQADGDHFIPTIRHVDLYARADGDKGVVHERIFFD